MNLIEQAEGIDWRKACHEYVLENLKTGSQLVEANWNPYFEYLLNHNPRKFQSVFQSTAKIDNPFTPITQTVNEARSFIKDGVLDFNYLLLSRIKKMKLTSKHLLRIPSLDNPSHAYYYLYWDEIKDFHFDFKTTNVFRITIAGSIYGGSRFISRYNALKLYQLGKPFNSTVTKDKQNHFIDSIKKFEQLEE